MRDCTKFVGLDLHKSTITVAIAEGDRRPPVSYGLIENTPEAIARLAKRLSKGTRVRFCYEAGPCGYEVHRQITALGHQCDVVAPSLIPRKAEKTSEVVQSIAWKAQKRLCRRYQAHLVRGRMKVQACAAIARELSGFIRAIVCEVLGKHRVCSPRAAM